MKSVPHKKAKCPIIEIRKIVYEYRNNDESDLDLLDLITRIFWEIDVNDCYEKCRKHKKMITKKQ